MNKTDANTSIVQIHLPDGATNAIEIFPAAIHSSPVLIILPAMGVKATYYKKFAARLAGEGIHVVTADQRGNGNSSLRPSRKINFGYKEQVEIEYPAILEAVKKRFPLSKIFIMGHSLGGQMGGMFAATRYDISGLILNASCSVYYKGWKGASAAGVLIGSQFSRVVSMLMGYFPGNRLGFGGKESRGVISDWAYTAYSGNFKAKGSDIDYNAAMKSCNVPVLALSYEGDTAAPYQSVKNLLEKFSSSATLQHHFNPESGGRKYDHYSWVRDPDLCIPVIQRWINSI